jgi:hypothetical protein
MHPVLRRLEGGDRRSIGRSNEVVAEVLAAPSLFGVLFSGMLADDAVLRARAADAVEKVTRVHPEYLQSRKAALIGPLARLEQKEVRWHVAQMLPRVGWSVPQRRRVLEILAAYLDDPSSLVKTFAMQALAELALLHPSLRPNVGARLRKLTATGTPAMRSRGRILLGRLEEAAPQRR